MKDTKSDHLILGAFLLRCIKTVSHPPKRYNALGKAADAFAQKLNMGIQRTVASVEIVSPHVGDQLFARKSDVTVPHEIKEKVVFLGRKRKLRAV